jgi:hypothetical protein
MIVGSRKRSSIAAVSVLSPTSAGFQPPKVRFEVRMIEPVRSVAVGDKGRF